MSLRIRLALILCGVGVLAAGAAVAAFAGARELAAGLLALQVVSAGVLLGLVCGGVCGRLEALKKQVEGGGPVTGAGECSELGRSIGRLLEAHRATMAACHEHLNVVLESEARCRQGAQALIDGLPHGVALLTRTGRVELVNARGRWFGLEREKAAEEAPHAWLKDMVARALATRQRAGMVNSGDGKEGGGAGCRHCREGLVQMFEEGREMFFLPAAEPLIDAQGNLTGVVVTLVDVTATRQAEEARANLLASFAHEIRTPMTSLQMSIYLLLDDAASRLTPRQLELLQAAREDADRLHRIVEGVLVPRQAQGRSGETAAG